MYIMKKWLENKHIMKIQVEKTHNSKNVKRWLLFSLWSVYIAGICSLLLPSNLKRAKLF